MDDISIDVISRLPEDEKQGTFTIHTSEHTTIAGVIRKVCKENGIPMKTGYVIRDSHEKVLQWSKTLHQCRVQHGSSLYLSSEDEEVEVSGGCSWNTWWFVAAICLLIGGVGITSISILLTRNGATVYQFGVVLDAGSSHTKLFVYRWDGAKLHETALARQIDVCKVEDDGLTNYTNNVTALAAPLSKCLEVAKHKVPGDKHKDTPIFLGATAGMRMLNVTDPDKTAAIFREVRKTISAYPFHFASPREQARIISGMEEGTFGWITVNYLAGKFGVSQPRISGHNNYRAGSKGEGTVGALDMGGASTQITFYTPEKLQSQYEEDLKLYGDHFKVYSHSYLCYGINEAVRRYKAVLVRDQGYNETDVISPCAPQDSVVNDTYTEVFEAPCATRFAGEFASRQLEDEIDKNMTYRFVGTSNTSACNSAVLKLFNFTADKNVSFNGVFQPPVHGQFYAFSSFFYEMDFLNLTRKNETFSLQQVTEKLTTLCKKTWAEVKTMKHDGGDFILPWYCFEGQYILTLLTKGYKFDNTSWSNINFVDKVAHTDVGWSLGFMLNSSNIIAPQGPETFISNTLFGGLTALFVIFVILSIAFGCYARSYQRQADGVYQRLPTYGAV